MQQHIVKIFYMGITLKERHIKWYVLNCHLPKVTFDRLVMIFYGICNFLFISYTDVLLQYLKSA